MTNALKSYPTYRNSGVRWLNEIPEHWRVRKLKFEASFQGGGTPTKAVNDYWNGNIPWVSPKDMKHRKIWDAADHITEDAVKSSATNLIAPRAVLIVVRSGILRRSIPVAINAVEVALNQDMKALRTSSELIPEYLQYLIEGNQDELLTEWTKHGATVESIEYELMANSLVPIPSLSEQLAIVRFLEHADRRIRRYILTKQKLIKRLEEHKQAAINRAVTRGVDPSVQLKPSNIRGMDGVPEHWDERRLKYASGGVTVGVVVNPSSYFDYAGTVPMLLGNNILPGRFRLDHVEMISAASNKRLAKSMLAAGDLVVVRVGAPGVAAVVPESLDESNCASVIIVRKGTCCYPKWLEMTFNSSVVRVQVDVVKYGAAQKQFNVSHAVEFRIPVPPMAEQEQILKMLEIQLGEIEPVINAAQQSIRLLHEYRTRLIADVVTGKLDVRAAAANLPDEVGEPDDLPLTDEMLEDVNDSELASGGLVEEEAVE